MPREKRRRLAMQLNKRGALLLLAPLFGRVLARSRNGDAAFIGDRAHGLHEIAFIHLHDELEHISAHTAAEAVIDLLHRMHRKRRRLFGMKRAEPRKVLPILFQAHILAHHADDVRLLLHAIGKGTRFRHSVAFASLF